MEKYHCQSHKDDEDDTLLIVDKDDARYMEARNGDHLSGIPFQCDICHFRNLNHRDPIEDRHQDRNTLVAIRRANLDSFWGREPRTVIDNLGRLRHIYQVGRHTVSLEESLPMMVPFPLEDVVGMGTAIVVLEQSLRPGTYAHYLQYDSMRKYRTAFAHARASTGHVMTRSVMAQGDRKMYVTDCPTRTEWFERFMRGARLRMGMIKRKNIGLTEEMTHGMLKLMSDSWENENDDQVKGRIAEVAVYLLCTICGGLRGEEVPLLALQGILEFWDRGRTNPTPHVMLTLRGRFKGETGLRWHLLPLADDTRTKLPVRKWFGRLLHYLVEVCERQTGWVFQINQRRGKIADYDTLFISFGLQLQEANPTIFPEGTELTQVLSLWRSGRRGSNTVAVNQNLDEIAINLNNRWRKTERAKGAEPGQSMLASYTQIEHALPGLLRYGQIQ